MGALGHYLEEEELSTVQISLVREHTEKIRPPRALWVPFELGRPMGVPDDAPFQKRVLVAALGLLERKAGPVLTDFLEDAPTNGNIDGWVCPVQLAPPPDPEGRGETESAIAAEIAQLDPWYELTRSRRGRTTVGISGIDVESAGRFVARFLADQSIESYRADLSIPDAVNMACEDLKAYYLEAAAARSSSNSSQQMADWFWGETAAGKIILALKPICLASEDEKIQRLGQIVLVPRIQVHRVE